MMNNLTAIKNQTGAALVVGMIVLLVMTLLGVSTMSTMTTELKMANNAQTHNTAFQIAASGLNAALDVTSTVDTGVGGTQTFNYPVADTTDLSRSTVTITYSGCQLVPVGYSLTQDLTMKGLIHDFRSTAQVINDGAQVIGTTTHISGIQTIRPGCPTGAVAQ
ncbi:MAG: pilus assembly PilX family protein [Gammaproteobacteria bacterium]